MQGESLFGKDNTCYCSDPGLEVCKMEEGAIGSQIVSLQSLTLKGIVKDLGPRYREKSNRLLVPRKRRSTHGGGEERRRRRKIVPASSSLDPGKQDMLRHLGEIMGCHRRLRVGFSCANNRRGSMGLFQLH